jgi:hypothetical protein
VKRITLAVMLLGGAVNAQTIEQLQEQLRQKEAEINELKTKIEEMTKVRSAQEARREELRPEFEAFLRDREKRRPEDDEAATRALERALVREGGALLPAGTFEVEPFFNYSHAERTEANFRRDAFGPGVEVRAGLPWHFQFSANLPYVVEYTNDASGSRTTHGIGDPTFSLTYQMLREREWVPNLFTTLNYKPDVGRNTTFLSTAPVAIGSGFTTLSAGLTATKRRDPVVVFGSYNFLHTFSERKNGVEVELGNDHNVRMGTIFAASPDTSLRAAFDLTFQDSIRVGDLVVDRHKPVGIFEIGGAMVLSERALFDVVLGVGVTNSAPDYRIAVALPIRF